jgi:two-component system, LytTR family, sensor histidine kinase AlgZ
VFLHLISMKKLTRIQKTILQILLFNSVATIFVLMLNSSAGLTVRNISFTVIYSFCIGTFCGLAVHFGVPNIHKFNWILRIPIFAIGLFLAIYLGVLSGNTLLYLIGFVKFNNIIPLNWQILAVPLGIGFIFGSGAYFYESSQARLVATKEQLKQKEIDEAKANTLATEAQLASLESRIHPHFLFNTLNSIAALIREEPILAEKTVEKLSALLRYSLDSNAKSLVSLAQELEITEKYLEIEKIRFDKRLIYKIECEPNFFGTKIPPLSLQTLVENSIKHVVSNTSAQTEIKVSVVEINKSIEIKVCDSGKGFAEKDLQENHGLDILRKRLLTIFGDKASLQIIENATGCVILRLPKSS